MATAAWEAMIDRVCRSLSVNGPPRLLSASSTPMRRSRMRIGTPIIVRASKRIFSPTWR